MKPTGKLLFAYQSLIISEKKVKTAEEKLKRFTNSVKFAASDPAMPMFLAAILDQCIQESEENQKSN